MSTEQLPPNDPLPSPLPQSQQPPKAYDEPRTKPHTLDSAPAAVTPTMPKPWPRPFLIFGALAGIPIPLLFWLWLALSIREASKIGWTKGVLGVGIFLGTGIAVRLLIGILIVLLAGGN